MLNIKFNLIKIRRKTRVEYRYHPKMGKLTTKVTRIQKTLLGYVPFKTIHKYRETYRGEVKDCEDCIISKV
jgi:hypothetical protein